MPRRSKAPPNEIVLEGVDRFPENQEIINELLKTRTPPSAKTLLQFYPEKYHGNDKPGCILVKLRRERTHQDHYLDIYACLVCGLHKECLRSGWEIGWYGGTYSRTLQ